MICPFCKKDYKDVPEGKLEGGVARVDDHYYKKYTRRGRHCNSCGKTGEFIEKATGDEYYKRKIEDENQTHLFDSHQGDVSP